MQNESYYGESIRHLDIRSGKHIGVSPFTGKKVKPSNNSAICDHLLNCNFLPSFDNFSVLAHEILHLCTLFHVSLFKLVSLFPSKYHYIIVKKKLFISIKHDLIGRDMPETRRQKILIKNLD